MSQMIVMRYIDSGLFKKLGGMSMVMRVEVPDVKERIKQGDKLEDIITEKMKEHGLTYSVKKMPCGVLETDSQHSPVLLCEYCDHKLSEASIPGFC